MKAQRLAATLAVWWTLVSAQGVAAQGQPIPSNDFVAAVREKDGAKAEELLNKHGLTLVNAKDSAGDTALLVAIGRRDSNWTSFLLNQGADPNLANRKGERPLIAAARIGYLTGVEYLLIKRAKIDETNRMGETALITAVQGRHAPVVRLLLSQGANPDKTDNAAGYSARDYARRDSRSPEILRLIEAAKKPASAAAKPIG